ncbi:hypothetical protein [Roseateles sp.]|uniref:hypothetical protein n=1 Tax=Roseateles sp. TaxID=1971397 RepID=UPI00286C76C2|nr:hypothetical protein [Roseateles sp.]
MPASTALCSPRQQVVFHCSLGAKSVSLCAVTNGQRATTLEYRYGTQAKLELTQEASTAQPFKAMQSQLTPGARVRQVWFDRGGYTYLLSQCIGGACPYSAGLAVLQGEKVVMNRRCMRTADDRASFVPELARFGGDAASSEAKTELLVFEDMDLGVERLYPTR